MKTEITFKDSAAVVELDVELPEGTRLISHPVMSPGGAHWFARTKDGSNILVNWDSIKYIRTFPREEDTKQPGLPL